MFLGTWQWRKDDPNEGNYAPWVRIGITIRDKEVFDPVAFFVYGYDKGGRRTIYYNTEDKKREGPIQKGSETKDKVAFWFDESVVDHGTIVAVLDVDNWNKQTSISLEYAHSRTNGNI